MASPNHMTRATVYLNRKLWLAFRKACLDQETSASKVMEQLVREHMAKAQQASPN